MLGELLLLVRSVEQEEHTKYHRAQPRNAPVALPPPPPPLYSTTGAECFFVVLQGAKSYDFKQAILLIHFADV